MSRTILIVDDKASVRRLVGDVYLDRATHVVQVRGAPVHLTPSEFDLLAVLISAPGRFFPRLELLSRLRKVL